MTKKNWILSKEYSDIVVGIRKCISTSHDLSSYPLEILVLVNARRSALGKNHIRFIGGYIRTMG